MDYTKLKTQIEQKGFVILPEVYTEIKVKQILDILKSQTSTNQNFRKSKELFAIRQFLKEIPEIKDLLFTETLVKLIKNIFGSNYFIVKSIYFDKPELSNWFVPWHQDLTISVDKKLKLERFSSWTVKQGQYAVKPPLEYLKNIYTIRIHLDTTDKENGALKVLEGSHSHGFSDSSDVKIEHYTETTCMVPSGGIMIMKPLLIHSSQKSNGKKQRRVIHIEFANQELPDKLNWSEKALI